LGEAVQVRGGDRAAQQQDIVEQLDSSRIEAVE
jgi:hypothetical protein